MAVWDCASCSSSSSFSSSFYPGVCRMEVIALLFFFSLFILKCVFSFLPFRIEIQGQRVCYVVSCCVMLCACVRMHVSITHGERIKDVERFMYVCMYVCM